MKSPLHQQVLATIRKHGMLRAGDRAGVAVSGGADSVALLQLLGELSGELGISMCVLHVNHRLRGNESDADETFVAEMAKASGIEFLCASVDVAGEAKRHGWNLEDAARRLRYEFFARIVREGHATKVATAHSADDQAETVLARLIRGTGPAGLTAILPVRQAIIRPLLDVRRKSLRDYLKERGQEWREDATNQDTRRLRARLRHGLLPLLEKHFSAAIVERLGGLAGLAREEDVFWKAIAEDRFEALVGGEHGTFRIRTKDLLRPLPFLRSGTPVEYPMMALTQRLVRRIYAGLGGEAGQISLRHAEQVIRLAARGSSGRKLELPAGVSVAREFDCMVFQRTEDKKETASRKKGAAATESYQYELNIPAEGTLSVRVAELERCFRLKVIDWPIPERDTRQQGQILDAERLRVPLVLRNWRPGDSYRPSGHREAHKLKLMFAARRIGASERALWPVLTSGGQIAWAARMPVAAEFSASEKTRTGLWISEQVN